MRTEPPRRFKLPVAMGLFMLVYGGVIDVFAVESLVEGDLSGIGTFMLGIFIVALGTVCDRDRHRDYVAEARREEQLEREAADSNGKTT